MSEKYFRIVAVLAILLSFINAQGLNFDERLYHRSLMSDGWWLVHVPL